ILIFSISLANNLEQSTDMNITATIIKPLVVNSSDMNFGTIVAGSKNNIASAPLTISYDSSERIVITVDSQTKTSNGINLVNKDGDLLPVKLSSIGDYPVPNIHWFGGEHTSFVSHNGKLNLKFQGTIDTNLNQKSGLYSGNVTFKVRYN
ncbi:hypothetical protein, partial [Cetobacterium sp.]|uniref:hypothetical protein n=1 Tax=Cetobacterium sp. TaxID=2071632 RepID=UPI002FC8F990